MALALVDVTKTGVDLSRSSAVQLRAREFAVIGEQCAQLLVELG